jgi:hypothetical protein
MSKEEQLAFIKSLDAEGRESLAKAIRYYNDVLIGSSNVAGEK